MCYRAKQMWVMVKGHPKPFAVNYSQMSDQPFSSLVIASASISLL